jgi:hypothetical protein
MFITKTAETSFVANEAYDELLLPTTKPFKNVLRFVFCSQPTIRFYIISAPDIASYNLATEMSE